MKGPSIEMGGTLEALTASRVRQIGTRPSRVGADNPVGEGFEALLLGQLFQTMQKTVGKSGLFGEQVGGDLYGHMIEVAMGEHLAASGGIGLAALFEPPRGVGLRVHEATRQPTEARLEGPQPATLRGDGSERPLAEVLPPQEDLWLDAPDAALRLKQMLAGQPESDGAGEKY